MASSPIQIHDWRPFVERAARAAIVIACYLIVFLGLLITVASGTGATP